MTRIPALVLRAPGTNCERETAHALELAGAAPVLRHLKEVQADPAALDEVALVVLPGGFSYGDDLGAGRIQAEEIRATFLEPLCRLVERGGLVLGICNGFQVLVKLGLLPTIDPAGAPPSVSLTWNDSGRYEDRWVHLEVTARKSPFLARGPARLHLPVAHAEGKFVVRDASVLDRLEAAGQVALGYVDPQGRPAGFPWNPNGSIGHVAGITDPSGRVLGLMPHPERNVLAGHDPRPGRAPRVGPPDGLGFFVSAVETLRGEL
ncbi:MAG: phosphoribosylformylglycinamidine synthase I [Planctomycetes bacterium]|nr:phosphoribosylformylglycinamidine synthase I [Planctomycetota bacterium]